MMTMKCKTSEFRLTSSCEPVYYFVKRNGVIASIPHAVA